MPFEATLITPATVLKEKLDNMAITNFVSR